MIKRLTLAFAQAKASNNSESLLNEIRQIVYFLYQSKEITKKVYNNIIKSVKYDTKWILFITSENSRTSKYHVLILKLTDKLDLRRAEKSIALSNISIAYTWKNIKGSFITQYKFKISAPTRNDEFELLDESYLMSDIQDYFEYILKNIMEILIIHQ